MFCKGVCYAEALISIYRVSWAFVAVGEWSIVLCHVFWDPPTFTWNYGQNKILQNVVVFLRILQKVFVFIMIFIIWVHVDEQSDMHLDFCRWMSHEILVVLWRLYLYDFRMLLDQIIFEICLGTCARSHKVELSLHIHALWDFVCFVQYQLPYVSKSCWIRLDLAFGFAFYFPATVLFMSEKTWSKIELSELRELQNVSFVSLRMIFKTLIWCSQILIVKHWWSATWKTSRMIFLMEYS